MSRTHPAWWRSRGRRRLHIRVSAPCGESGHGSRVALLPNQPARWPLAALAPALALVAVAGAWPALAARAHTAWQRATLAATGWIWLLLAAPLAGVDPYIHTMVAPPRSAWLASPYDAV